MLYIINITRKIRKNKYGEICMERMVLLIIIYFIQLSKLFLIFFSVKFTYHSYYQFHNHKELNLFLIQINENQQAKYFL